MNWKPLPEAVCHMDAASERTWTYLQRVSGDGFQLISRIVQILPHPESVRAIDNTTKLTGQYCYHIQNV